MKKILLTAMCAISIFLSACHTESSSVGVIGGADGPTAILVSNNFPIALPVIIISAAALITAVVLVIHIFNKKD